MVSRNGLAAVLDRLAFEANTRVAVRVLGLLLSRMGKDGLVPFSPLEIACRLRVHHAQVYRVLKSLEDMGAITVERPTRRETAIRVNANLASGLAKVERDAAQAKAPPVKRRASQQPVAA